MAIEFRGIVKRAELKQRAPFKSKPGAEETEHYIDCEVELLDGKTCYFNTPAARKDQFGHKRAVVFYLTPKAATWVVCQQGKLQKRIHLGDQIIFTGIIKVEKIGKNGPYLKITHAEQIFSVTPTPQEKIPEQKDKVMTGEELLKLNDREVYTEICEFIEKNHWIKTAQLLRRMHVPKGQPNKFRQHLYALEALGVLEKHGQRQFTWATKANWREILKGDITPSPQPFKTGDHDHTPCNKKIADLETTIAIRKEEADADAKVLRETGLQLEYLASELSEAKKTQKLIIEIHKNGKKKVVKKRTHKQFPKTVQLAAARKHILLVGPAGCGKSFLCQQVAEEFGLQFGHINCSIGMSEGQLTGRQIPTGKGGTFEYHSTSFVDCYEKGGVFLMDEIDAADPNVLIVLNTALANGRLPVPNRSKKPYANRHKDFIFMAAANTFGRGADRQYVGRNELDEATIDRFRIGLVELDYDDGMRSARGNDLPKFETPQHFIAEMKNVESLESELCPNDDLRNRFQWYRKQIQKNRIERIVSTRFLIDANDMMQAAEWTIEDCESQFFAGWNQDEIRRVRTA